MHSTSINLRESTGPCLRPSAHSSCRYALQYHATGWRCKKALHIHVADRNFWSSCNRSSLSYPSSFLISSSCSDQRCVHAVRTCIAAYLLCDSAVHPTNINLRESTRPCLRPSAHSSCRYALQYHATGWRCKYELHIRVEDRNFWNTRN